MSLNIEQQKAVDSNAKRILCLAGAGTGKSHTVLSRIARLVNDGVDVSNILALTFTNAAAFEMRERYTRNHPNQSLPTFCTFHSFCYQLIANNTDVRTYLGYTQPPSLPDDAEVKRIDTFVKQQCKTKLSVDKLSGKKTLMPKERFDYDLYWKQFKKLLKQQNLITFDIMCYDICELFTHNNPFVDKYKKQYTHIFVDEFQDTDPKQWEFVSSFKESNLVVVGDAKQAIYSFRGADSSIIKSLAEDDDWETIKLYRNYRSTKQVCDFSNKIHSSWSGSKFNLNIESNKSGAMVTVKYSKQPIKQDMIDVVQSIEQLSNGTIAILCRSNAEVSEVKDVLNENAIAFNSNRSSLYNNHILKSSIDNTYMIDWFSTLLSAQKYSEYIRLCAIDEQYKTADKFIEMYGNQYSIANAIEKINKIRNILSTKQHAFQKCANILEVLKLPVTLVDVNNNTATDIINAIISVINQKTESDVYVGTIHSVKGLEYDNVYLLGVGGRSFTLKGEDNLNLYYVGCTRAMKNLCVYNYE